MLTGKYKEFYDKLTEFIPKERMFHDPLTTLAFGTDASFYRLIPKLVVSLFLYGSKADTHGCIQDGHSCNIQGCRNFSQRTVNI